MAQIVDRISEESAKGKCGRKFYLKGKFES